MEVTRRQGFIILSVVACLMGTNPCFVKIMLEESALPASGCAALRFGIAALVMTPALFTSALERAADRAKSRFSDRTASWCFAAELGAWLALGYGLQTVALTRIEPLEASVYLAFFLVLVPVFERLHGRPFSLGKLAALLVALVGLTLLSAGASAPQGRGRLRAHAGMLAGLTSSTMFALHLVRCEVLQRHVKSVLHLGAAQMACCAGLLAAWATVDMGLPLPPAATPAQLLATVPWSTTIFTAVFSTACCQTGELVAVSKVEASTAALSLSAVSVWGVGFGIVYKGTSMSLLQCAGGLCIVLSATVPRLVSFVQEHRQARTMRLPRAR